MCVEFKGKITLHYSRGVKSQQGFTTAIGFYVYNVSGEEDSMDHNGVEINVSDIQSSDPNSFSRRGEYKLISNVDIVNLSLKNNGWRERRAHFVIFVVGKF